MKRNDYITIAWNDYELIDSGEGRKLERFATTILDRPDPQALWKKTDLSVWNSANARFVWAQKGERWDTELSQEHQQWVVSCPLHTGVVMRLLIGLGTFKHIGMFPEHMAQWQTIAQLCKKNTSLKVLNLFGYTGAASIAAAAMGAQVTHVDASKQTIGTVKKNMQLSGLPHDAMRLITEDALRYVKRLTQRGETFDIIVMDPPAFGRGPKGEVWKIEEKLPELLTYIPQLLSKNPVSVILNGYAAGYSARSFGELLQEYVPETGTLSYGDVGIQQTLLSKGRSRVVSTGIYAQWTV